MSIPAVHLVQDLQRHVNKLMQAVTNAMTDLKACFSSVDVFRRSLIDSLPHVPGMEAI